MTWKLSHIVRALRWSKELSITLFDFWKKNPDKSMSVLGFVLEKMSSFPKFLNRNVFIEQRNHSFEDSLDSIEKIFQKYKTMNLYDKKVIAKLEKILTSRSQYLYLIVRKTKPEIVLETGVAAGESTGYILKAMSLNKKGHLYSIDLPFQWYVYGDNKLHLDSLPAGKLPGYVIPEDLKNRWSLKIGDTYKVLPNLVKSLKKLDIFIHDSEHTYKTMTYEYKTAWSSIKKGGLLISDDVHFTNAFDDFCDEKKLKKIRFTTLGLAWK